jgi:hypothetical protein
VGELVRQGQEEGTIRTHGVNQHQKDVESANILSPMEAAGVNHRSEVRPLRQLAAASPEHFDAAIEEAKAEGELSRGKMPATVSRSDPSSRRPRRPMLRVRH